jgi:hypothetical protein
MNQTICIDKTHFLLMLILICLVVWYFQEKTNKENLANHELPHAPEIIHNDQVKQVIADQIIDDETLTARDIRASSDPFYPPWRRLPRHQYPPISIRKVMNIPTRGYTDNFQYLGNLVRKVDEKIVQLYGREEYPGSDKWEYYGYTTDSNGLQFKFKINSRKNELYDGAEINLPLLDLSKGKFKLHMNDFDIPRYDPYLI